MIIDQLPLLDGNPQDADDFPIERGVTSYKTKFLTFATAVLAKLVKDARPTQDSTNPVESGGVYTAMREDLQSDASPQMDGAASAGTSVKLSREDHVHPHDSSKQDTLTFDQTPTDNSSNPVTSGGVYTAISNIAQLHARIVSASPATTNIASQGFAEITVDENPPETLIGVSPMYASSPLVVISNVYLYNGTTSHGIEDGVQSGDVLKVSIGNFTSSAKQIPAATGETVKLVEFYT